MKLNNLITRLKTDIDSSQRLYLLASPHKEMLRDLYANTDTYRAPLFETTPLESLSHASPWLCEIKEQSAILKVFEHNTETKTGWQGILIYAPTEVSFSQLITLLRNRLFVKFGNEQKGVLHYQLPAVAHYLLSESSKADTLEWMNCISAIIWHSPLANIQDEIAWRVQTNEAADNQLQVVNTNQDYALTETQQSALKIGPIDQLILNWQTSDEIELSLSEFKNIRALTIQAETLDMFNNTEMTHLFFQAINQHPDHAKKLLAQLKKLDNPQRLSLLERMQQQDMELHNAE
ncbi:DUF4123 domain-containing protein [Neptuniibacter sp. QD57_21]|uniref:DUF4123 domain-containing protein n=1 Tax=Neptuniibacter sp. QD57_21 TaxID=3398213 RepID=UPI0039F61564